MARKQGGPFWLRDSSRPTNLTSVEAEIMRVVWDAAGPVTVRDVYEELRRRKKIAYTTTMTLMTKLAKKGFLNQDKSGTAYVYAANVTDAEVAGSMLDSIAEKVLGGATAPMISHILGSKKELTPGQVSELKKLLRKKQ
ncbi:MAG: BlaI/MecI/CopY family transcriptional regulator [Thermoleophilia bacterium]|nr:BlaI/MecI/CopY family transcriptional regulator [Thermoleophilia bacterium]